MSGVVKFVGKAIGGVGKAIGGALKSVGKIVKKIAPIAAPIAMIAFPGIGTALGAKLGLSGTAATLAGGGLIGAGGALIGGQNPLYGGLLGAGGAYLGSGFGGYEGLLGGGAAGTGLTPGAAGASGIYGTVPAVSGYNLAASSTYPFAGAMGGLGTGIYPTAAMATAAPAAGLSTTSMLLGLNLAGGLLAPRQQVQQMPMQYPMAPPVAGQPNFAPTISLLTQPVFPQTLI
jgi:hypothetical protein